MLRTGRMFGVAFMLVLGAWLALPVGASASGEALVAWLPSEARLTVSLQSGDAIAGDSLRMQYNDAGNYVFTANHVMSVADAALPYCTPVSSLTVICVGSVISKLVISWPAILVLEGWNAPVDATAYGNFNPDWIVSCDKARPDARLRNLGGTPGELELRGSDGADTVRLHDYSDRCNGTEFDTSFQTTTFALAGGRDTVTFDNDLPYNSQATVNFLGEGGDDTFSFLRASYVTDAKVLFSGGAGNDSVTLEGSERRDFFTLVNDTVAFNLTGGRTTVQVRDIEDMRMETLDGEDVVNVSTSTAKRGANELADTDTYIDLGLSQDELAYLANYRGTAQRQVLAGLGNDKVIVKLPDGTYRVKLGAGSDTFTGSGGGRMSVDGEAGNDRITTGSGRDTVHGGDGNDTIRGGLGNDTVYGDAGDDHLYGERGVDRLYGALGNDWLYGGAGKDRGSGGPGRNHLTGM